MPDSHRVRRVRPGSFGVLGRAGFLVVAVLLAASTTGPKLTVALAGGWGITLAVCPRGFSVLRRPALWGLLALIALPPVLLLTPRDLMLPLGFPVSAEGCRVAMTMAARSLLIAVAAAGFVATVSVRELTDLLEVFGLRGLGFSLGVAAHALPLARHTWSTSARALRLRGGFRRHPGRDVVLLCTTVVGNALRHADEVVEAAQARGFSADRRARSLPAGWRTDAAWLALMVVLSSLLLFA